MKISDYLSTENIFLDADLPDKNSILQFIADACVKTGNAKDRQEIYQGLCQRENTMSTGIGGGLAFPHTTSGETENPAVIVLRLKRSVDFESLDKKPVDIVLALIIPRSDREIHVRLLARISRLCRDNSFLGAVRSAKTAGELLENMQAAEKETSP
ncbi:MAG: PTS sugar transporter subunit IIA [Desulfosalsimonas sp.]